MRLLFHGAAEDLDKYAVSPLFDFVGHAEVTRPILQGIEKLMAILEAERETKQ